MSGTTLAFPTPASLGSLDHYIQAVNRFPLLTAEQEVELGRRLSATTTSTPRASSCCRTCGSSSSVSRNYLGYGLPQADLIQEGNVGLMKAVQRFDPERGVRLVSFALHWIKAEIHEYILRNWRLVKVATTKAQRKLFFNLRSMKRGRRTPVARRGARDRDGRSSVKPEEVVEMETRLSGRDIALDPQPDDDGELDGADRLPHRPRGRAGADPRARADGEQPHRRPRERAREARRPQPPHHRGALARARTIRRRCRSSPTSTASPPSGFARSRARR